MQDRYFTEVISPGDRASKLAKEICFQGHKNCPSVTVVPHQPNNFRGPVGFVWKGHILEQMMNGVMFEEVENDGAGGKPQFFTLIGTPEVFRGLGWEIITMNADDFARSGRLPCVIANEMNVKRISEKNFPLFRSTMEGYGAALKKAGMVNITGETAIMRHSITAFCDVDSQDQLVLTWGGTCIGLARKDLLIDGSSIEPKMAVVAFFENGYRCNGGTFFTNLMQELWGFDPAKITQSQEARAFAKALTIPSTIYARTITRLIGWKPDGSVGKPLARIYGVAHITGGGVWGKFQELLPEGVGASLLFLPPPPQILRHAQELSWDTQFRLSDFQAYGTLNGGIGMLIICDPDDIEKIVGEAKKDGVSADHVGWTMESDKREIIIHSRFKEGEEKSKVLSSLEPE